MSVPTFIGYLLLAFSAGLVLHPAFAFVSRRISDRLWNRKVRVVTATLRAEGWTILGPDETIPQLDARRPKAPSSDPLDGWGEVETGIGFTTRGNTGVWS